MRTALLVLSAALLGLAGGCDDIQLKGGREPDAAFERATTWPFIPVVMRVHPFTAIEFPEGEGEATLEARVEMLDRLGDVTKAVGDFRFELYRMTRDEFDTPAEGELLYRWSAGMTTLDQNRQHWDSITRTYLFRLKMDSVPRISGRLLLVVHFTDPGSRHMQAQAVVALSDQP